jgi:hypothetical protein
VAVVSEKPVITDAQVQEYRDKGFIVVNDIYSSEEIERMREVLEELIAGARGLSEHDSVYDLEPSHTPDEPRVRRIKLPYMAHPLFREMAGHPRVIAVLSRLIGPNVRLHYPHTNDDVLAVGVMLDDMTVDNGPMLVIPGSHRGPTYDHHQDGHFIGAMDAETSGIDFSTAETITGRAGDCSFHPVRAVHGSAKNTSGRDRRLLLYQVAAADAWDLRGMSEGSWEDHEASMLAGEASIEPRVVPTPIRLPYPGPLRAGSIYESQSLVRNRYFGFKDDNEK